MRLQRRHMSLRRLIRNKSGNSYEWDCSSLPEPLPAELLNDIKQGSSRSSVVTQQRRAELNQSWSEVAADY